MKDQGGVDLTPPPNVVGIKGNNIQSLTISLTRQEFKAKVFQGKTQISIFVRNAS